jgi:hypothetical protein
MLRRRPFSPKWFNVYVAGSQKQLALRFVLYSYMLVIPCCVQKIKTYTTLHLSDITSKFLSVTACEIHANEQKNKMEFVVRLLNDHLHRFTSHQCQTEKYLRKSHCRHVICSYRKTVINFSTTYLKHLKILLQKMVSLCIK